MKRHWIHSYQKWLPRHHPCYRRHSYPKCPPPRHRSPKLKKRKIMFLDKLWSNLTTNLKNGRNRKLRTVSFKMRNLSKMNEITKKMRRKSNRNTRQSLRPICKPPKFNLPLIPKTITPKTQKRINTLKLRVELSPS